MQQKRLRGKGGRSHNVIFSQERGRYVKPVFPKGVGLDSLGGRAWARGLASALQCPVGSLPELPMERIRARVQERQVAGRALPLAANSPSPVLLPPQRHSSMTLAGKVRRLAVDATLRAAAPHQPARRRRAQAQGKRGRRIYIDQGDLRQVCPLY